MFHRNTPIALVLVLVLALLGFGIPIASAAPPINDDVGGAIAINALPYSNRQSTLEANYEYYYPPPFCTSNPVASVWYALTLPSGGLVEISTAGSSYSASISVYTGQPYSLTALPYCGVDLMHFSASPGVTYYIMVAGFLSPYAPPQLGGDLVISAQQVLPSGNDNFADAITIAGVPYSGTFDTTGTTLEDGENPGPCDGGPLAGSIWYAFTPAADKIYWMHFTPYYAFSLAVYQGSRLPDLQLVACRAYSHELGFQAAAGTTYYIQIGGHNGQQGIQPFLLDVAPPPTASFYAWPSEPSIFDQVYFYDQSVDPATQGIQSIAWDFGGGVTADGCCTTHHYTADGDYPIKLTVTTPDGRVGTITKILLVRTHDVAVTKLLAPTSGQSGKSTRITASVLNKRYPETVTVELQKSDPTYYTGFATVASLTRFMRVSSKAEAFNFNYTFMPSDAAMGKITFRVVVTLPYPTRDAVVADNTLIAPPTAVKR
jgi:PKD repeat protein